MVNWNQALPKYHKFDPEAWHTLMCMFNDIGVNTCVDRGYITHANTDPGTNSTVYVKLQDSPIIMNIYPIQWYYVLQTDLRKYYRLMYLYNLSHPNSNRAKLLIDIARMITTPVDPEYED